MRVRGEGDVRDGGLGSVVERQVLHPAAIDQRIEHSDFGGVLLCTADVTCGAIGIGLRGDRTAGFPGRDVVLGVGIWDLDGTTMA